MALQLSVYFQTYSVSTLYVDDCFLLFKSLDHVPLFLNYLNRQHPNIYFTSELEKDGKLPFLDVDITRLNGKFSTSVYRKPTFTGLFTNFHSFIPLAYKRSLISCLLYRIFNLCSSYENFPTQHIRKLFNLNDFPSHMFDCLVHRFLNKIFEPKPPIYTVLKKVHRFTLSSDSHSNQPTLQCCLYSSQHSIYLSLLQTHLFFLSFQG